MASAPKFEVVPEHEFKVRERVFLKDENGHDIYEYTIYAIDGTKYTLKSDEDRKDVKEVEGTERILVKTRDNTKIFKDQEMKRATSKLGSDDEDDVEDDADEDEAEGEDEDEDGFDDDDDEPKKKSRRGKKGKMDKTVKPRPAGCRSNPRRGQKDE